MKKNGVKGPIHVIVSKADATTSYQLQKLFAKKELELNHHLSKLCVYAIQNVCETDYVYNVYLFNIKTYYIKICMYISILCICV